MPIYAYECEACGLRFERPQSIAEVPLTECPVCRGRVDRLVSGGAGFIIKKSSLGRMKHTSGQCYLEEMGSTCCGRDERCEKPPCREEP
jgi:putative FmdB family regulatory protein